MRVCGKNPICRTARLYHHVRLRCVRVSEERIMPLLAGLIPLLGILLKMLIVRIIIATGMTFVTYAGYLIALNKFKDYTANAINSMPSDILNLLLISGFGQGLGYLFGAFSFYIGMKTLNKLTFVFPR